MVSPDLGGEQAAGRPCEALNVNQGESRMIQWSDSQDVAEEPAPPPSDAAY